MSLFGSIGKALFGDPTKGIEKATAQSVAGQKEGLDYLKSVDAPALGYRNEALGGLSDYYLGDEEGQQQFINEAKANPFYQSSIDVGEEAVLRNAAATGGVRGGAVQPALAQNSQNVLKDYISQKLRGLEGFANIPLNTGSIAQGYSNIGETRGRGTTAANQAEQDIAGKTIDLGLKAAGAYASDVTLKRDISLIGEYKGFNWYKWTWNELANAIGLKGSSEGVIAQEVQKVKPYSVIKQNGYLAVKYSEL